MNLNKQFVKTTNINKDLIVILAIASFFIFQNMPFFGDTAYFSKLASYIYEGRFIDFLKDTTQNNGNPPLYSILLSFTWQVLGQSLASSHFVIMLIFYYSLKEINKFAKINNLKSQFALIILLIFADTSIMTQYLIMSPDILLMLLFWIAVNAIIEKDISKLRIIYALILLTHLKGIYIFMSLLTIDAFINNSYRNIIKSILIPLACLALWFVFHYKQTGWFLLSQPNQEYMQLENVNMFFRNSLYSLHKILDFGRLVPFLIISFLIILNPKAIFQNKENKHLLYILIIPVIIYLLMFGFTKIPVSHRHFLFIFPALYIAIVKLTDRMTNPVKITLISITVASLILGNLIVYPQKYGNGWDASLKLIYYFKAEKNLKEYIKKKNIPTHTIASKYPMFYSEKYTLLLNSPKTLEFVENNDIKEVNYNYFIYTNASNEFTTTDVEFITNQMTLVKDFSERQVEMRLYKRENID